MPDRNHRAIPWQHRVGVLEFVMSSYFAGGVITIIVLEQYLYHRFIRGDTPVLNNTNATECTSEQLPKEIYAEKQSATWLMYIMIAPTFPAIVATISMGSYSDQNGRRIVLVFVCVTSFLRAAITLVVAAWDLSLWLLVVAYFIEGVGGTDGAASMVLLSMVADIYPDAEQRTRRIAIMESINGLVLSLIPLPIGYLIQATDYWCVILGATGMLLVSVTIAVLIPETKVIDNLCESRSISILRAVTIYTRKIPGVNRRSSLVVCLAIIALVFQVLVLKRPIETLYTLKSPFCWSPVELGVYIMVAMVIKYGTVLILLKYLQSCFSNITIATCGLASAAIGLAVEALAQTDTIIFVAAGLGFLALVSPPLINATLSNLVSPNEQGTAYQVTGGMFSVVACVKLLTKPAIVIGVMQAYYATVEWRPGFIFHVMASMACVGVVLLLILKRLTSTSQDYTPIDERDDESRTP